MKFDPAFFGDLIDFEAGTYDQSRNTRSQSKTPATNTAAAGVKPGEVGGKTTAAPSRTKASASPGPAKNSASPGPNEAATKQGNVKPYTGTSKVIPMFWLIW